ncbi:MAG: hypothetical protein ACRDLQ_07310, partial [Solirubrobacterales bacterium]
TRSDIQSTGALRRLLRLMLGVIDKPIKQVKFHGRLGESYVTASPVQIKAAVHQFLYLRPAKGPLSRNRKRSKSAREGGRGAGKVPLIDVTATGKAQADLAKERVGFPVYYPRRLVPRSSFAEDTPRTYTITGANDKRYRAYKMVFFTGFIGEYYGLQGTSWKDPPILHSPSETRRIRGREYMLFFNGDRLRVVAWRTKKGAYWVSNTLLQSLSAKEMLGVARWVSRVK